MIGVIVASVVALALLALARGLFWGYPLAASSARYLSRKEQAIVAACADALFPPGGPIPVSGTEAGLVAYMDGYVGRMPKAQRLLSRLLLILIEHGPWLFGPRRTRFTRLSMAERVAALDLLRVSNVYFLRIAFLSMRTMLTMGYLANGDVARSMGMAMKARPYEEAFA